MPGPGGAGDSGRRDGNRSRRPGLERTAEGHRDPGICGGAVLPGELPAVPYAGIRGFAAVVYAFMLFLINFTCLSAILTVLFATGNIGDVPISVWFVFIGY